MQQRGDPHEVGRLREALDPGHRDRDARSRPAPVLIDVLGGLERLERDRDAGERARCRCRRCPRPSGPRRCGGARPSAGSRADRAPARPTSSSTGGVGLAAAAPSTTSVTAVGLAAADADGRAGLAGRGGRDGGGATASCVARDAARARRRASRRPTGASSSVALASPSRLSTRVGWGAGPGVTAPRRRAPLGGEGGADQPEVEGLGLRLGQLVAELGHGDAAAEGQLERADAGRDLGHDGGGLGQAVGERRRVRGGGGGRGRTAAGPRPTRTSIAEAPPTTMVRRYPVRRRILGGAMCSPCSRQTPRSARWEVRFPFGRFLPLSADRQQRLAAAQQ